MLFMVRLGKLPNQERLILHNNYLLTVNRRLARSLKAARAKGEGPLNAFAGKIMAFDDFLAATYESQRVSGNAYWRLSSLQERMLWVESLSHCYTLGFSREQTIQSARDAYARVKAYQLTTGQLQGYKEDGDLFVQSMQLFEEKCHALGAIASSAVLEHTLPFPCENIIFYGFDEFTPAQQSLIDQFSSGGTRIEIMPQPHRPSTVVKTAAIDRQDELYRAACYAQKMHEQGKTMAIVVPQLQSEWHAVERQMAAVFKPGYYFPGAPVSDTPYNISAGESLSAQPMIHALLQTFELLQRETRIQVWQNILHSPFIKGGMSEASERAVFDFIIHDTESLTLTLDTVRQMDVAIPEILREQLEQVSFIKSSIYQNRSMKAWMIWLKDWIATWGWAQERTLNSAEYQCVNMFYEILPSLFQYDVLKQSCSFREFLDALHVLLKETLFQIETQDKPIQVLGLLEAAGLSFDCIWIVGLTADVFPGRASPHPFLPTQTQIQLNMPHCSSSRELQVAQRLLDRLLVSADHVILSYPMHDASGEVQLESPLIAQYSYQSMNELVETPSRMSRVIAQCQHMHEYQDDNGSALSNIHLKGGSAVFKDQSACAFRGYLKHRLGARAPKSPVMGLSEAMQGKIAHEILEKFWSSIKTQAALIALDDESIRDDMIKHIELVLHQVSPALAARSIEIESQRLIDLMCRWVEIEKSREPFQVIATEQRIDAQVFGLNVKLTIDRIDQVQNDQTLLIDYKTGDVRIESWNDDRMDEPQLPLYAIVSNPTPADISFACLKKNKMGMKRIHEEDPIKWQSMLQTFRERISRLADEIKRGYAAKNPKNGSSTCETCDLQSGCRLYTGGVNAG